MMNLIKIKGSAIAVINRMFFLLAAVMLIFSGYNYLMYRDIGVRYQKSTDMYYEAIAIKEAIKQCDTSMEDYLINGNRGYLSEHNEAVKRMEQMVENCRNMVDTPAAASFIQSISDAFYSYQTAANYGAFSYAENNYYEGRLSFQESREIGNYIQEYCDEILEVLLDKNRDYYLWLRKKQRQLLFINLYAVLLLAAAAGYSVYYVNDTFYRPLTELCQASREIAEGTMARVRENWQDEMIQILAAAFNKMSRNIGRMMKDIHKNGEIKAELLAEQLKNEQYARRLEQAEFLNQQLQTNPHFLFNTLNTISRTIILGMDEEAVEMIDSMAAMLRYNLNDLKESVTVYEELEIVKEYIHIHSFRFRDRVEGEFDYEESLTKQVRIPRFSLQPFVENAVIHGLEPKTEPGKVWVRVLRDNGNCIVTIEDNGVGIPKDKLEALNRGMQVPSGKRKSVGISNTVERLRFFTKDRECVNIKSELGEGLWGYACGCGRQPGLRDCETLQPGEEHRPWVFKAGL